MTDFINREYSKLIDGINYVAKPSASHPFQVQVSEASDSTYVIDFSDFHNPSCSCGEDSCLHRQVAQETATFNWLMRRGEPAKPPPPPQKPFAAEMPKWRSA
jgi:hypothetical protein